MTVVEAMRIPACVSLLLALGISSCVSQPVYECSSSTQCVSADGAQGTCTPDNYCAYPDASCGQLGLRYSEHASGEFSSTCLSARPANSCIEEVTAGIEFSCATKDDGSVWCWGQNDHGQLGGGELGAARDVPMRVALPASVRAVSVGAGEVHACALSSEGRVYCWGGGDALQLGLGPDDADDHATPVEVHFPGAVLPITNLSVGAAHTCAIDSASGVWCWGENNHEECGQSFGEPCPGQPADEEVCESVPVPMRVGGGSFLARFVISGDEFTCAIDALNELSCWGDNSLGELGLGTLQVTGGWSDTQTPLPNRSGVGSFLTIDSSESEPVFAAGAEHACAVVGGSVLCWGSNTSAQLGAGHKSPSEATPLVVESARGIVIGCMAKHSCSIDGADGALSCWGNNSDGQVGIGSSEDSLTPTPIPLVAVREAALGDRHSCALVNGGGLYCWGANDRGQLGLPISSAVLSPIPSLAPATICQ